MSTVPAVEIDGNDVTDELQDKSFSIKLNSVDLTLIDPAVMPLISDTLTVDTPAWTGGVVVVETVGYEGDVPFVKVRATNGDALPDNGAGAFNLSDAGTPQGSPASFRDLSVNQQLQQGVTEVRAKVTIFKEGLEAGDEIALTSAVHGYTAETFTIMDLTTDYPVNDGARYTLDLGLGDYATATTGAGDGGPLSPVHLGKKKKGGGGTTDGGGDGSGEIDGGYLMAIAVEATAIPTGAGTTNIPFDDVYLANDPYTSQSGVIPAWMGLSLLSSNTLFTALENGVWQVTALAVRNYGNPTYTGYLNFSHDMYIGNPTFVVPESWGDTTADTPTGITFSFTVSLKVGETFQFAVHNDTAGEPCLNLVAAVIVRLGGYTPGDGII